MSFSLYPVFPTRVKDSKVNLVDNDRVKIDFRPLYECIHIYTMLDSLEEFQTSYQADRKVSLLILSLSL